MGYTVHGKIGGRECHLVWDEGHLTGDTEAMSVFEAELEAAEASAIGPPGGPYAAGAEAVLASGLACYTLIVEAVFDEVISMEGDKPAPPDPPEGALY